MKHKFVFGETLSEAWHNSLVALGGCPSSARGTSNECMMDITALRPLAEPMISKAYFGGPADLEQYRQEMLNGILDFEGERGNWKYTYHSRYKDQYGFVIDELRRDPDTRRAVMDIRSPEDIGSDDPACWQHIQFFNRDGKLHAVTLFRSNDAVKAAFANMFALIMLQKRVADAVGLEVGTYTHRANSYHCYSKDEPMLEEFCKRYYRGDDLTIFYEGDWDELMAEARPAIAAKVKVLKQRKNKE